MDIQCVAGRTPEYSSRHCRTADPTPEFRHRWIGVVPRLFVRDRDDVALQRTHIVELQFAAREQRADIRINVAAMKRVRTLRSGQPMRSLRRFRARPPHPRDRQSSVSVPLSGVTIVWPFFSRATTDLRAVPTPGSTTDTKTVSRWPIVDDRIQPIRGFPDVVGRDFVCEIVDRDDA